MKNQRLEEEEVIWDRLSTERNESHSRAMQALRDIQANTLVTLENDPSAPIFSPNEEQDDANDNGVSTLLSVKNLSVWVSKSLQDVTLDVHHLESVIAKAQVQESKTRSSCESLFSMMLKAYGDREKEKPVDPMAMLKLLSVSQSL
jgi:hypothetical protein